jgi:homoserine O-succinyltransferase
MPLILPDGLPAIDMLKCENINIEDMLAKEDDKRPLRIVILNLMPFKATTETDFIRLLSNSPLLLDISFMKLKSHVSRHTPAEHIDRFYHTLEELRKEKIDGLIVTGAPVEDIPFEEVDYWKELQEIFNWARENVRSTLYICWAAQAGLYHFYDIPKYPLPKKMFGIFPTIPLKPELPIFRGFDDVFRMPQSRHTEIRREDIERVADLDIVAESAESGVSIVRSCSRREFFLTGHLEYAPDTLDTEYHRDLGKRDDVEVPKHYYRDDNPANGPLVTWRAHANLLFVNWVAWVVNDGC